MLPPNRNLPTPGLRGAGGPRRGPGQSTPLPRLRSPSTRARTRRPAAADASASQARTTRPRAHTHSNKRTDHARAQRRKAAWIEAGEWLRGRDQPARTGNPALRDRPTGSPVDRSEPGLCPRRDEEAPPGDSPSCAGDCAGAAPRTAADRRTATTPIDPRAACFFYGLELPATNHEPRRALFWRGVASTPYPPSFRRSMSRGITELAGAVNSDGVGVDILRGRW